jgi:cytochrome d ubiquinol oxidase subunit II
MFFARRRRAKNIVTPLWLILAVLTIVSLVATMAVRPQSLNNYFNYPITFVVPVGVVASLAGVWLLNRKEQPVKAFLCSCLYLFFMLAGACWGLYPTLLPATTGADRDITLSRALSGPHTLAVGLAWWIFGMTLAVGYVVFVYSKFRGKVDLVPNRH